MEIKYINNQNWQNFLLNQIAKYKLFSPFESNPSGQPVTTGQASPPDQDSRAGESNYDYLRLSVDNLKTTVLGKYRTLTPVKSFFFPPLEKIVPINQKKQKIIVGIKACELAHLRLLDNMFLGGEYRDPVYEDARKNTIIISADCTSAKECCFCSIIEGKPYPTYGFDINLRPIKNGFVVEFLSEQGKELITDSKQLFQNTIQDHIDESEKNRVSVNELILKTNKDFKFAKSLDAVVRLPKTDLWKDISKECVECGACRFSCSTCYCFLIGESKDFGKYRLWDACQFKGYAGVAGGGNPKPTKEKRYKNLYSCKLDYRKENFGYYACTGCGRCIESCPAEIDIREVITRIVAHE